MIYTKESKTRQYYTCKHKERSDVLELRYKRNYKLSKKRATPAMNANANQRKMMNFTISSAEGIYI